MDSNSARFTGFEGLHLAADVWGDPDGWPVLFMHGGGQTRHAWGGAAQAVAEKGWRAVSIDLRGHGDSEWALNGDYAFSTFANDAICVADALGRPPVFVGASLGGIASLLAEGLSDRVVSTALVIVDITHKSNPDGVQRITDFMTSGLDGFDTLEDAAEVIAAYTPNRPKRVNHAGLMKVLRQRGDGRWYWHWDPTFISRGRREVPGADYASLLVAAVDRIRVPTLLVCGKLSDVVTTEGTEEFLEKIPGSRLVDVSGASHMVAGDKNDAFATAVIEFLETDVRPLLPT